VSESAASTSRPLACAADRPIASIEGISKRFGPLLAIDDVSIVLPRGRVVGIVGENGAGKTTVMNVLAGIYVPDAGAVKIEGEPLLLGSPMRAVAAGIGMVHQHFKLVETLSGAANVSLALDRGRFLQPRLVGAPVEQLLRELGFEIDLAARVWQMPLAERQQLEILRTLAAGAKILVLDEPTSVLSPIETRNLFSIVRRIASSGRTVVLISHKLNEVLAVADTVVVMRAGRVVHEGPTSVVDIPSLARLIVGNREIREGGRSEVTPGVAMLRVEGLRVLDDLGAVVVDDVSLEVRSGEIVAVVGVSGNGQTQLMEAIGALRTAERGTVVAPKNPRGRGFAYIPSQHLGTALAPNLPVSDNALLGFQRRTPFGWWLMQSDVVQHAEAVIRLFGVIAERRTPVRWLSGGNLQRLVMGREIASDPTVIVADYPTRGLDVASAAQIRTALVACAKRGCAVLMSSEELDESLEIANRLLVMHRGRIVAEQMAGSIDVTDLGRLMTMGRT
jgi:simple sugar transport system ATP-binding protein